MAVRDVVQAAAGVGGAGEYVEDVFSTYLFTGTGTTTAITNGIDLDGEGGLVWIKDRDSGAKGHALFDTERGGQYKLQTQWTGAQTSYNNIVFNSDGFTNDTLGDNNGSGTTYASWTFRKSPKFFDVVTYAGNSVGGRQIPHNLGSVPGMVIVKNIDAGTSWRIWHRAVPGDTNDTSLLSFTTSPAELNKTNIWAPNGMTDSYFTVSTTSPNNINETGYNYVAYFFAHDAGGFGDDGEQNVISCGSYTTDAGGEGPIVNLGWEPQFIIQKDINYSGGSGGDWDISDNMRGFLTTSQMSSKFLEANTSATEQSNRYLGLNSTGFRSGGTASHTYIYIAIRRPMKTPESGTEVFNSVLVNSSLSLQNVDAGFPVDLAIKDYRNLANGAMWFDRLRGITSNPAVRLMSSITTAEGNSTDIHSAYQTGVAEDSIGATGYTSVDWFFKRAPGFMDVVCYTGTGSGTTVIHNLGVAPELIITKRRNSTSNWGAYHSFTPTQNGYNYLDLSGAGFNATYGTSSRAFQNQPTSTQFITGGQAQIDSSGGTYVAYLFASLPGVSKVGSYTGTAADLNVDCGFSAGARFILIKRTDSTGDWYVWDSARGIVSGNDPYLLLNSTAAEVTSTDYIDPLASGFTVTSSAPAALNASGGSYIFLAIA